MQEGIIHYLFVGSYIMVQNVLQYLHLVYAETVKKGVPRIEHKINEFIPDMLKIIYEAWGCIFPVTPITRVYFIPLYAPVFFYRIFLRKRRKQTFFQSTHFTRKSPWNLLILKLEIVDTVKFRLVLGIVRGYKYLYR